MNAERRPERAAHQQAWRPEFILSTEPSALNGLEDPVGESTPPVQVRLDFVRAVAGKSSSASTLTQSNTRDRVISQSDAIAADEVFFVEVRPEILAVDFDRHDAPIVVVSLAYAARLAGLEPVILNSGGPDRRHFFCRVKDPVWRSKLERLAASLGGDIRHSIRPPLTRHRLGGRSSLIEPVDAGAALGALARRSNGTPIGLDIWNAIVHGSTKPSKSEAIWSAALAVANRQWSFEEFATLMRCQGLGIALDFDQRVSERGNLATIRWLEHAVWEKAVAYVLANPSKVRRNPDVERMRRWVLRESWSGRTSSTDRAVMLGFLEMGTRLGCLDFDLSIRDLAVFSGVETNTADKAWRRLEKKGLITRTEKGRSGLDVGVEGFSRASRWRLHPPQVDEVEVEEVTEMPQVGHDAWRNRVGLGQSAQRVYGALCTHELTNSQITKATGLHRNTVNRQLKQLSDLGLVSKEGKVWSRLEVDLDLLAIDIGAAGKGDRQRARHAAERAAQNRYWSDRQANASSEDSTSTMERTNGNGPSEICTNLRHTVLTPPTT